MNFRGPTIGKRQGDGNVGGKSGIVGDGPSFVVDHLATFNVSPQNGVVSPSDGMRRLLQLEKNSGVWTQKMLLRLDRTWVNVLNYENGEVIEKFPLTLIHEATAFTSSSPVNRYNNIFVIVVQEDPVHREPAQLHIFNCVGVSAEVVVENLKMYKAGNFHPGAGSAAADAAATAAAKIASRSPYESSANEENSWDLVATSKEGDTDASKANDRNAKDGIILNRCFDDIETFVLRLQHIAAAQKELGQRKKTPKSKKKEQGDGMLAMRARPPTEAEFIDVFQKFKLSFNLLAKLKAYLHDPNAPELVHFLFSPLALIVEASQGSSPLSGLPARVVAPLLSHDAIELLSNCLSSKETELWFSLGDPWRIPKEKWKGYVNLYVPTFMGGWTPDSSFFQEEKEETRSPRNSDFSQKAPTKSQIEKLKNTMEEGLTSRYLEEDVASAPRMDIRKTPAAYISTESTPEEVQDWLKAKGFDVEIRKRFQGLGGEQLFQLKRPQLEKLFGRDEGRRLDSQLTLQRKYAGYQTIRSSELFQVFKAKERKTRQLEGGQREEPMGKRYPPEGQDSTRNEESTASPSRK